MACHGMACKQIPTNGSAGWDNAVQSIANLPLTHAFKMNSITIWNEYDLCDMVLKSYRIRIFIYGFVFVRVLRELRTFYIDFRWIFFLFSLSQNTPQSFLCLIISSNLRVVRCWSLLFQTKIFLLHFLFSFFCHFCNFSFPVSIWIVCATAQPR